MSELTERKAELYRTIYHLHDLQLWTGLNGDEEIKLRETKKELARIIVQGNKASK